MNNSVYFVFTDLFPLLAKQRKIHTILETFEQTISLHVNIEDERTLLKLNHVQVFIAFISLSKWQ